VREPAQLARGSLDNLVRQVDDRRL